MDLCLYLCALMCWWHTCVSVRARACPFLCWLTLFAAVVTALWSVSPAGGPRCAGWVCGGGVIVVSPGSWILEVRRERKWAWDPSVHPSTIPSSKPQTRSRASTKGSRGKLEKERETIWVSGNVRVTSIRVSRRGLLTFSWQGQAPGCLFLN